MKKKKNKGTNIDKIQKKTEEKSKKSKMNNRPQASQKNKKRMGLKIGCVILSPTTAKKKQRKHSLRLMEWGL